MTFTNSFVVGRDVEFVGDDDNGDAGVVELLKQSHDFDAGAGVEVARWLVGQHEFRPVYQRARDGDVVAENAKDYLSSTQVDEISKVSTKRIF